MKIHTIGDIQLYCPEPDADAEEVRGVLLSSGKEELQALAKLLSEHKEFIVVPAGAMIGIDHLISRLTAEVESLRKMATAAGLELETP